MRIACPHCQATYEIDDALADAIFICHRCKQEFRAVEDGDTDAALPEPEEQLPLFDAGGHDHSQAAEENGPASPADQGQREQTGTGFDATATVDFEVPTEMPEPEMPPPGSSKRLWPWFAAVLLLVISAGFVLQKEQWLDNRWFRSTLMNLGLPLAMRDKDWRVIPESVHAEWIIRDDDSRALLIEGRVENLLATEQPAPKIEVTFFDAEHPDRILLSRLHEITLPPTMETVRHAPFATPDRDIIPVAARGQRGFVLLLESLPESTGEFALTARAPK